MADVERSRFLGSALILAGTAIGAGMLALPLVAASTGLVLMLSVFVIIAILAIYSGLLTLEVNLAVEPGSNLYTMASRTLGRVGRLLSILAPLGLFYALMTAYLSGGGTLTYQYLKTVFPELPLPYSIFLFAAFSSAFVFYSTAAVDYLNRISFFIMVFCLIAGLLILLPSVEYNNMLQPSDSGYFAIIAAIPVVFTSFGFHGSIPSIILYQKNNHKTIPKILFLAGVIPLFVYSIWLIGVMGNIPVNTLATINSSSSATAGLVEALVDAAGSEKNLGLIIHVFSDSALLTSVLGVALGLFDYLAHLLRRSNSYKHRAQTALITFVPPVLFSITYPECFISALGYAAIALSILAVLLPAFMVLSIRNKSEESKGYRAPGGRWMIGLCILFGGLIILAQLVSVVW